MFARKVRIKGTVSVDRQSQDISPDLYSAPYKKAIDRQAIASLFMTELTSSSAYLDFLHPGRSSPLHSEKDSALPQGMPG